MDAEQTSNVNVLETNLREITSPIIRKMQSFDLTPKEIEVVSYLKDGRTTKQIAELLGVSPRAIGFTAIISERSWDWTKRRRT